MNKKFLAYLVLLAGWLCFCYWLYAKGIYPRLQEILEKSLPLDSIYSPYPLAFEWGSEEPLLGVGFEQLKAGFQRLDSTDEIVVIQGYYFRDETDSIDKGMELANRRILHAVKKLEMNQSRIISGVFVQEIHADVRANPFEAIQFQKLPFSEIMKLGEDTLEICFPLKDSLVLPAVCYDRLTEWIMKNEKSKASMTHIVGTADGSGIAESIDIAMERAMVIKDQLMNAGWKEDQIQLSTGQRSHPHALHNRCVIIYFE